ncbi:MAG: phenylalanine--tRNA ligase subunit beta [Bacillota bacterium]
MQVPYRWLSEYVKLDIQPEELADRLTRAGVHVDEVAKRRAEFEGVRTGIIRAIEQADGMRVCSVSVGDAELSIVTGATNVRAGDRVAVAVPGAVLPRGQRVETAVVRGRRSEGMLCCATELLLGEGPGNREGVLILPADTPIGTDVAQALELYDDVLVLDLTPNYAHCQSLVGLSWEVSAVTGAPLHTPPTGPLKEQGGALDGGGTVRVLAQDLCPRYVLRVFEAVTVAPSPLWMQWRLLLSGVRPISNIVDITNYVMLEMGQPIHAFDARRVKDRAIIVRRAVPGEIIRTLDGEQRTLSDDMLVIADSSGAVGIAGVMGGENSEVSDDTSSILLESAYFSPSSIASTSRRLGLRTEASARFERGVDPSGTARAADRCAYLVEEMGIGRVRKGVIDVDVMRHEPRRVLVRPDKVNALLGTDIKEAEMQRILERLNFSVTAAPEGLWVEVPPRRVDVLQEVDVAEEVARLWGYDRIETTLPSGKLTRGGKSARRRWHDAMRDRLLAMGLDEIITYSFVDPATADMLGLGPHDELRRAIPLANPLRPEQSVMRTTLLGGLLETAAHNLKRRIESMRFFELGPVYRPRALPLSELPDERVCVAGAAFGHRKRHFGEPAREADFFEVKGWVENLAAHAGVRPEFIRSDLVFLHPGRQASVRVGESILGYLGEVHPDVLERYGIGKRVVVFEIDLDSLYACEAASPRYSPLARFPAVERDLAVMVPRVVSAADVEAIIRREGGSLLEKLELFDVYTGPPVPEGYVSLAYSMRYRSCDRTLSDEDAEAVQARIRESLIREIGASLRS